MPRLERLVLEGEEVLGILVHQRLHALDAGLRLLQLLRLHRAPLPLLFDAQPAVLLQRRHTLAAQLLLLLLLRAQRLDGEQQRVDLLVRQVHCPHPPRPLARANHQHPDTDGRARMATAARAAALSRSATA